MWKLVRLLFLAIEDILRSGFFLISSLLIGSLLWVGTLHADTLAFSRNARTFELQHSSLIVKSLAHSCLALKEVHDGLPCNPGYVTKTKKAGLRIEGLLSNGYSNLSRTRRILNNQFDQDVMNDFFQDQNVLQTETFLDLMFVSSMISSRYSPISYKLFTVIRNSANPDVDLYAVEESDLLVQMGRSWGNFDFGLEIKSTEWKFIRQRFKLLSLATQQGLNQIRPKTQTTFFLNPSISYEFKTADWSPRVVVQGTNLGTISEAYSEFPHPAEVIVGFGVSPPIPYGVLDFLLDYKSLNFEETPGERLHFGSLYRLGAMSLGAGLDSNGSSLGIYQGLESVNAGILFTSTRQPWRTNDYYAETVSFQLGWQL